MNENILLIVIATSITIMIAGIVFWGHMIKKRYHLSAKTREDQVKRKRDTAYMVFSAILLIVGVMGYQAFAAYRTIPIIIVHFKDSTLLSVAISYLMPTILGLFGLILIMLLIQGFRYVISVRKTDYTLAN